MSGECDKCGEHALECECRSKKDMVMNMFRSIGEKVLKEMKEDQIRNADNSRLTNKAIQETLITIEKCEYFLDILLTQTEEIGGFGSFYPKECQKNLKTMKFILEAEK